jgi:hypothetical protein
MAVLGEKLHWVAKRPPLVDKCLQTVLEENEDFEQQWEHRVSFVNALLRYCGRIISQGSQVLCIAASLRPRLLVLPILSPSYDRILGQYSKRFTFISQKVIER